jgi:hypothetical protein
MTVREGSMEMTAFAQRLGGDKVGHMAVWESRTK